MAESPFGRQAALAPNRTGRRALEAKRVVPMIHVPDVRATVAWYTAIGFKVIDTYGDGGEGLSFAILSFGTTEVMFNSGGQPGTRDRREVDLYVYTDNVDDLYRRLKDRVDVVERPHDTFYGMREFIFRDLNRFWLTFAQAAQVRHASKLATNPIAGFIHQTGKIPFEKIHELLADTKSLDAFVSALIGAAADENFKIRLADTFNKNREAVARDFIELRSLIGLGEWPSENQSLKNQIEAKRVNKAPTKSAAKKATSSKSISKAAKKK